MSTIRVHHFHSSTIPQQKVPNDDLETARCISSKQNRLQLLLHCCSVIWSLATLDAEGVWGSLHRLQGIKESERKIYKVALPQLGTLTTATVWCFGWLQTPHCHDHRLVPLMHHAGGDPHLRLHPQAEIGWEVSQIPAQGVEEVGSGLKFWSKHITIIETWMEHHGTSWNWLGFIANIANSPCHFFGFEKIADNDSILRLHPGLVYQALDAWRKLEVASRRVLHCYIKIGKITVGCVHTCKFGLPIPKF